MDDSTIAVYEQRAEEWNARRASRTTDHASIFRRDVRKQNDNALAVDLGCGPGWYSADLGPGPVVAVDAARAMLDLVPGYAPAAWRVQADLTALPFRRDAIDAAWASKSYVHLSRGQLPLALADLHRVLSTDAPSELVVFGGDMELDEFEDDEFAGRRFSLWDQAQLLDVVTGAGFETTSFTREEGKNGSTQLRLRLRRVRTLPDFVTPGMRVLMVGLNPSIYSADAGVGFARPGNRFWPAALAAGLVSRDRDAFHALTAHGMGMTDLVKRATVRAEELASDEYRTGYARVARLATWLRPRAVCVVGLTGWRTAVDRRATTGWQHHQLGGTPVYLMPNTSGLNARVPLSELTAHFRAVFDRAG